MHFIVIFGPPAVGKMSVGDEITALTGIPVFHNHLSIEPILKFFPFGSDPFIRLVDTFRRNMMTEVAQSDLPGIIFTFVWSFSVDEDAIFMADLCQIFEDAGADITLIELKADLDVRLIRNRTEKRLAEKPSKRDIAKSEKLLLEHEGEHQLNSGGSIPLKHRHIIIDNTNRTAEDVATEVVDLLSLPRRPHL